MGGSPLPPTFPDQRVLSGGEDFLEPFSDFLFVLSECQVTLWGLRNGTPTFRLSGSSALLVGLGVASGMVTLRVGC